MANKELGNVKISLSDTIYSSIKNQLMGVIDTIPSIRTDRVIVVYGDKFYSKSDVVNYINSKDWNLPNTNSSTIENSLGHLSYLNTAGTWALEPNLDTLPVGLEGLDAVNIDFSNLININSIGIDINIKFNELFNIPNNNSDNLYYLGILAIVFLDENNNYSLMSSFYPFNEYGNSFRVKSKLVIGE